MVIVVEGQHKLFAVFETEIFFFFLVTVFFLVLVIIRE
jgi:hypothetical protein